MAAEIKEGQVYDSVRDRAYWVSGLGPGAISPQEWIAICRGVVKAKNSMDDPWDAHQLIEVGTLGGKTTHALSRLLSLLYWDGVQIITIDKDRNCRWVLDGAPRSRTCPVRIQFFHGTAREYFGQFLTPELHPPVRFAFIDGCHCEGCVKADLEAIIPSTKRGSVIAFHDAANQRDLGMLVHERYHGDGKPRPYGVREAISSEVNGLLRGWRQLEVVPPVERPKGAPTPIMGGLETWMRM